MTSGLKRSEAATEPVMSALVSQFPQNDRSPVLLIVEDEILLRMAIADEMRKQGFIVFEAATGDEALMVLRSYPHVDAVFSDVRMPGSVDGIALAEIVNRYYPRAKMLLTSGIEVRIPENGAAAGFFPKPYLTTHVAGAIKKACGLSA